MATRRPSAKKQAARVVEPEGKERELVILTGLSGSGKLSALKTFEDLGFYSVDNLPLELIPRFADLVAKSAEIARAALVVDVRWVSCIIFFMLDYASVAIASACLPVFSW